MNVISPEAPAADDSLHRLEQLADISQQLLARARALGATPLFLRYNTGRHIADNGRELADQLEALSEAQLRYKGLDRQRSRLVARLRQDAGSENRS